MHDKRPLPPPAGLGLALLEPPVKVCPQCLNGEPIERINGLPMHRDPEHGGRVLCEHAQPEGSA